MSLCHGLIDSLDQDRSEYTLYPFDLEDIFNSKFIW
jgi:hypothetical protein